MDLEDVGHGEADLGGGRSIGVLAFNPENVLVTFDDPGLEGGFFRHDGIGAELCPRLRRECSEKDQGGEMEPARPRAVILNPES